MTDKHQIEQFIEKIFPTQDVNKLSAEEKAKEKQRQLEQSNDQKEALWLLLAVVLVLLMIGAFMVGLNSFMASAVRANKRVRWVLPGYWEHSSAVWGSRFLGAR